MASQEFVSSGVNSILIAPNVFESIATAAALEVAGVQQISTSIVGDFFGRKGVKVDIGENDVVIHISIVVEYGLRIPLVAGEIQQKVMDSVEKMTGFAVKSVNVSIQTLHLPDNKNVKS